MNNIESGYFRDFFYAARNYLPVFRHVMSHIEKALPKSLEMAIVDQVRAGNNKRASH